MTEYFVPTAVGQAEHVEKRSRFIGRVWPVETETQALSHIRQTREAHWDAAHNVYAYILRDGGIMRYSDDGEPQGTGGLPALGVFRSREIVNVCCVVTRYFGGTLLGAGGLVRAYSHTAALAMDAAGIGAVRFWREALLTCTYRQYEWVKKELADMGAVLEKTDYGADILIAALVPEDQAEAVRTALADRSAGTVRLELLGARPRMVPLR